MHLLHNSLSFDFLRALSGIDYLQQDEIEVVAHLFSYSQRAQVVIKTRIERAAPQLASVQDIWPAANWHEREIFDLLGVNFTDHPDLRRILLPDDWQGFPLRKDYQEPEFYQGIPTRRHKPELSTNNLTESK
ncbi:MAG: NADH-quinone oxidoreductase subunit C [Deltaproteobacteria bacterium]|nr:NADH-quinone oxidoreductase subunit C [Deltaproteobacteria bacterium]